MSLEPDLAAPKDGVLFGIYWPTVFDTDEFFGRIGGNSSLALKFFELGNANVNQFRMSVRSS